MPQPTETHIEDLPMVESPASAFVRAAAERFVTAANGPRVSEAGGPFDLLIKVIPFLEDEPDPEVAVRMPLKRVVGESWAWVTPEPRPGREDLATYLLLPDRAAENGQDIAKAWWLPQLGLGVMHEGKNRVAYLRDICGAEAMPARVSRMSMPAADRLRLVTADIGGIAFHVVTLDQRWLALVAYPDLTVPLLGAYGVHAQPWPQRMPPLEELLGAPGWDCSRGRTHHAFDLQEWTERHRELETVVTGSPTDLDGVAMYWPGIRRLSWTALASAVLAGAVAALQPPGVLGIAVLAGVAVVTGVVMATTTHVVQGPRKLWRHGHVSGVARADRQ